MKSHVVNSFRQAQPEDIPAILDLFVNTVKTSCAKDYNAVEINAWVSSAEDRESWLQKIRQDYFLLAFNQSELCGFASLTDNACIDLLYVHHEKTGLGVGLALFLEIRKEAERRKFVCLHSRVSKTARIFFEKQGFEVAKENRVERQGIGLTNFTMQCYTVLMPDRLVVFDGICVLCNGLVDFLMKKDKKGKLHYTSFQGETAKTIPLVFTMENMSVAIIEKGKFYGKSDAVIRICLALGGIYSIMAAGYLLPRFIRNGLYDFLANNRYTWFGKRNKCRIPMENEKKFILP